MPQPSENKIPENSSLVSCIFTVSNYVKYVLTSGSPLQRENDPKNDFKFPDSKDTGYRDVCCEIFEILWNLPLGY